MTIPEYPTGSLSRNHSGASKHLIGYSGCPQSLQLCSTLLSRRRSSHWLLPQPINIHYDYHRYSCILVYGDVIYMTCHGRGLSGDDRAHTCPHWAILVMRTTTVLRMIAPITLSGFALVSSSVLDYLPQGKPSFKRL